jgi:hypothetical protein
LGCVSAIDSNGRTIWIADAHRGDGKRFVVRADEKLTAFLELESAIQARYSTKSKLLIGQIICWSVVIEICIESCFCLGSSRLTIGLLRRSLRDYNLRRMDLPKAGENNPHNHKQYACGNVVRFGSLVRDKRRRDAKTLQQEKNPSNE